MCEIRSIVISKRETSINLSAELFDYIKEQPDHKFTASNGIAFYCMVGATPGFENPGINCLYLSDAFRGKLVLINEQFDDYRQNFDMKLPCIIVAFREAAAEMKFNAKKIIEKYKKLSEDSRKIVDSILEI